MKRIGCAFGVVGGGRFFLKLLAGKTEQGNLTYVAFVMLGNEIFVAVAVKREENILLATVSHRQLFVVKQCTFVSRKAPNFGKIEIIVIVNQHKLAFAVVVKINLTCNAKSCQHTTLYFIFAVHKFIVRRAVALNIFIANRACEFVVFVLLRVRFSGRSHNAGNDYDNHNDDNKHKTDNACKYGVFVPVAFL